MHRFKPKRRAYGARIVSPRPPALELCRLENSHHLVRALRDVVKDAIHSAVGLCAGDLDLAAERLGISRAALEASLRETPIARAAL